LAFTMSALGHVDLDDGFEGTFFRFTLPRGGSEPKGSDRAFYVDLRNENSQAIVAVVSAAYMMGSNLKVYLYDADQSDMLVKWVQAEKV
jgi:hypothetical protein